MPYLSVFTNGGPDNNRDRGICPHRSVTERFYGTSNELRPLTLPRGYGYPTAPAHDATVVQGPRGFATPTVKGRDARYRFRVPGEYKLYSSIHPVLMSQVVRVR